MRYHYRCRAPVLIVIALLIAAGGTSSGCLWAPELANVRRDIERQIPQARFDKEIELSLGPLSLALARVVTRFVPDAREARSYLRDVRRIQIAVYNAHDLPPTTGVEMPAVLRELQAQGWVTAVKVRDGEELVWVLYRLENESVTELYVVALDDEELVLVRAKGKLEKLAARALQESGDTPGLPRLAHRGS
jgi:hypothetical protein